MNTRTLFFTGFLMAVLPTITNAVPPVATTLPPAVAVVQQFVTDRTTGHYSEAYMLLSTDSQRFRPAQDFAEGIPASAWSHAAEDGMTPLMTSVSAFFVDTHNVSGYTFEVIGPVPGDSSTVLVRVLPPGAATQKPLLLKIATTQDPTTHTPRLELIQSYQHTSPEDFIKMQEHTQAAVTHQTSEFNMKEIALGIYQYCQDHDEHFPDADKWVDEVMPYIKSEAAFHDPSAPASEKWSYAFNRNLSGVSMAQLASPTDTVMLFESTTGAKNASDLGTSVPHPGRHHGGADYGMADGHVNWHPDGAILSYKLNGK